jgi:ribosomal protein S27AE
MSDRHLDGNGVAGMLSELLVVDATVLRRTCQNCGDEHLLASHRAYEGAAMVLRCPGCNVVAVRVAAIGDELAVEWRGVYRAPRAP